MNSLILCFSNRPQLAREVQGCLHPLPVEIFDTNDLSGFSQVINHCIVEAYNKGFERVILVSDRFRPHEKDVKKVLDLLDKGYALACVGNWGFFGLSLDTVRLVGWMDERFKAGCSDSDYMIRCAMNNLAIYEANEVPNVRVNSSWKDLGIDHFQQKWFKQNDTYLKLLSEEEYDYDIGSFRGTEFLPYSESVTIFPELKNLKFDNKVWRSRSRPTFTWNQLWDYFLHLCFYQGRRVWNKYLRWKHK